MTTLEIIASILSSSLLSTSLISIVNWRVHNSNYKKEYYKKILDKRIEAYEKVQVVINKLKLKTQLEDSVIHSIFFNEESYTNFLFITIETINNSFWLDNFTSEKLTEFNVFLLNEISNQIDSNQEEKKRNQKYNSLGKMHTDKIYQFRIELEILINEELNQLHLLNRFFHSKKRNKDKKFGAFKSKYTYSS